jgi:hypothetical protein
MEAIGSVGDQQTSILRAKHLKPFIDKELTAATKPVHFIMAVCDSRSDPLRLPLDGRDTVLY